MEIDVVRFGGFRRSEISVISTLILHQANPDSNFVTGNLISIHAENTMNKQINKQETKSTLRGFQYHQ